MSDEQYAALERLQQFARFILALAHEAHDSAPIPLTAVQVRTFAERLDAELTVALGNAPEKR